MKKEKQVALLRRMVEIYSPSGEEQKLATCLIKILPELGFQKVWSDQMGNVYGEMGKGETSILLCGHMDTVPGRLEVKMENQCLYGRGTVDAKSALAAMICASSCFSIENNKVKLILAGVVEEESSGKGVHHLLQQNFKPDYAIFGEPSGIEKITFAYKGRIELKVTCKTVSGHIGAQHLLNNAIEKSFDLWRHLKSKFKEFESPNGIFYSLTPCLTKISSLRTSGGIPNLCVLTLDIRLPPTIGSLKVVQLVRSAINEFERSNLGSSFSIEIQDRIEPFVANRNNLLMKSLKRAISEITKCSPKFVRKTGTGDMNIYGAETDVPVATFGPGNAKLSHTLQENIGIKEYLTSIEIYRQVIRYLIDYTENKTM